MDDATREALHHATAGDWRAWAPYVDRLLDEANAARTAHDIADLEALYRNDDATTAAIAHGRTITAAAPFDHGADWFA